MHVLDKIFPSLRKSEEARKTNSDVAEANNRHDEATDLFMAAINKMVLHHDRVRGELAAYKRERRAQRHAANRK